MTQRYFRLVSFTSEPFSFRFCQSTIVSCKRKHYRSRSVDDIYILLYTIYILLLHHKNGLNFIYSDLYVKEKNKRCVRNSHLRQNNSRYIRIMVNHPNGNMMASCLFSNPNSNITSIFNRVMYALYWNILLRKEYKLFEHNYY